MTYNEYLIQTFKQHESKFELTEEEINDSVRNTPIEVIEAFLNAQRYKTKESYAALYNK